MSTLYVVRHGKASDFFRGSYDQLSEIGWEQARKLGAYWASWGLRFDRIYTGPRRRHKETQEAVAAVYRDAGLPWPEVIELPALDEHLGGQLFQKELPERMAGDPSIRGFVERIQEGAKKASGGESEKAERQAILDLFKDLMRRWARGEISGGIQESWEDFLRRVEGALQAITSTSTHGETVAIFTSAGTLAAISGLVTGLSSAWIMDASWVIRNSAYSEFAFRPGLISLVTFNSTPHLPRPDLITLI